MTYSILHIIGRIFSKWGIRLKKSLIIASLCVSLLSGSTALASGQNLSVYWQEDRQAKTFLTEAAYEDDGHLWLPGELIERIYPQAKVVGGELEVKIPLARLQTEYQELNRLLMRGMNLSFPLSYKDGKRYFAVTEAADVLGIGVKHTEEGILLTEEKGRRHLVKDNRAASLPAIDGKINLVWDVVTAETRKQDKIIGLDVLSPTWFDMEDAEGNLKNKASRAYVDEAHSKGYRVWALVTNSFDRDLTRKILASPRARQNVMRQLAVYSLIYDLDGINIDFENVYDEDKDRLTAFVGEMSDLFRKMGLVSSIDVTVPAQSSYWSLCFDRKALAEKVDYMMVMTYDEYWATSPVSGSVASLPWVETNIEKMLKLVPKEKLLLGIPLYTREWVETKEAGKVRTNSKTLWMEDVDAIIKDKQLIPTWLEEAGQDYLSYQEDGKTHRIWIENEKSIKSRLSLVHQYELAGVASWRKGFETDNIWPIYQDYLKPTLPQVEEASQEGLLKPSDDKKKDKKAKKEKRKKDKKKKKDKKSKKDQSKKS